jgi:uncharacterized membrane protein YfcA
VSAGTAWALAATALAAGVLRGFTGFGGALAMAPVFAVLLGPAASLGTVVAVNLLTSWQMLGASWRGCSAASCCRWRARPRRRPRSG